MYNVSNDFRTVMKTSAQCRRLHGTIGGVEFTQKNVLQGTFSITNQCSDNSNIQIGQVYTGELKATFRGLNIARSNWKGKEIVSYQGLQVNDAFEDVLLGHYFIDSAKWTKAGVSIVAYDIMTRFNKSLSLSSSSGKVYDFVILCCEACKVEFGMTKEEVQSFANGNDTLSIYEENDMETYLDLISWCAQTLGANATINREGKLIFKQYSDIITDSFNSKQRLDGGKFSDFDSFYTGVSVVNIRQKTTSYYGAEVDNGLTMNLGSNPLLQNGVEEVLEKQRRAILSAVEKINYTPMTMRLNTPLIYDLMDVIEFTGGMIGEGNSLKTCITKYVWKFNGDYEIECVGSDPALASGRSKVDKNIAGLITQVDENKTITYKFENASELNITENLLKIMSIAFTSKEKVTATFLAEILLDITANTFEKEITGTATYTETTTEGTETEVEVNKNVKFSCIEKTHPIVEIVYKLNNETIETFVPKQVCHEGSQIITLYYPLLSVPDNFSNTFEVFLKITDGTGKINKANALATISGQGLVAEYYEWDGNINIEENILPISFNKNKGLNISKFLHSINANAIYPERHSIIENFSSFAVGKGSFAINKSLNERINMS